MSESVFIETTIPSYYVARPSPHPIQIAHQAFTRRWWDAHRRRYALYTSQVVLEEAAGGETVMAEARVALLSAIELIDINEEVIDLADELVRKDIVPAVAFRDAYHLAAAGVHKMQFLLTWNCKHIANPHIRGRLRACFSLREIELPVICTPEQLLCDENDSED